MVMSQPKIQELPRSLDRMSFLYLDQCSINIDGGSIVAYHEGNRLLIPAASLTCLILGPGSKVTHDAIKLLAQSGTSITWMGADQTRFYASGKSLSSTSKLIEAQASIVSNQDRRIKCAKAMYAIRFPHENFNLATMQKLRGKEGSRMKQVYRSESERTGVEWDYRKYKVGDITTSDDVNRCLTNGAQILYAIEAAIITALGASTALGVIHMGLSQSFTYDMADLFRSEVLIPTAFDTARDHKDDEDIDRVMRSNLRTSLKKYEVIKRTIQYLYQLLLNETIDSSTIEVSINAPLQLWGPTDITAANTNYGEIA